MKTYLLSAWLLISLWIVDGFVNVYPRYRLYPAVDDPGEPLFLTSLIENGQIEEARQLANVQLNGTSVESYSGFLTVNKTFNSNLFFWFFLAEANYTSAPVVLWLQGGPGGSSLFGLFTENGPFYVTKEYQLKPRNISWHQIVNIIYIDNPVGTGYSFTDDDQGYATSEEDIGWDLYFALSQFFELFPELKQNDFFITGESYAGKYIPALSYTIHINNKIRSSKINLKGIAIGDGWCDPEHMMNYGDYLYQIGLIDFNQKNRFLLEEEMIIRYIKEKDYKKAYERNNRLMFGKSSLFYNYTGFEFLYNYLHNKDDNPNGDEGIFVQKDTVRKSIHVGNLTFHNADKVSFKLINDNMQSVKPWVEELVEEYKVIIYSGQLDVIVPYPLTVNFLNALDWSGAEEYKTAIRRQWYVEEGLAGYTKTVKNLTEVLVRNAGHMVPTDQPNWAFHILKNLVTNQSF